MPIWKLTPVDLTDYNWEASTHKGETIIRAATEERARNRAMLAFIIATKRGPNWREIPIAPWRNPDSVKCEQLNSRKYPEGGPEAILEPEYAEFET